MLIVMKCKQRKTRLPEKSKSVSLLIGILLFINYVIFWRGAGSRIHSVDFVRNSRIDIW